MKWKQRKTRLWTPDYSPRLTGYPCCCGGGSGPTHACVNCSTGYAPDQWDVTVPTISDQDCSHCSGFSGTKRLSQNGTYQCEWYYEYSDLCTTTNHKLWLQAYYDNIHSTYQINVWLDLVPGESIYWVKDYGASAPDCMSFTSSETIPFSIDGSSECSASADVTIKVV